MGYVFEELIRIGAEQSNEEAGEHFTPREVIKLMVNLLLSPEQDLRKSHVVKTIYDPACGTGGMLSVAERYIRDLNADAQPKLFGQDWNDEAWAVCKSDMLIKGEDADNIILGDTFTKDGFDRMADGKKNGHSTTCSPIHHSAWSGSSSRNTLRTSGTPSASAGVSGPAHPA
jgi:type I restriction enzyme M protein